MSKNIDPKKIAAELVKDYGEVECKKIIKELQKILDTCIVKVSYSGELDDSKKKVIADWIKEKVKGYHEVEYKKDESLISGLKIVYRDFDYEDSLLSEFRKISWEKE